MAYIVFWSRFALLSSHPEEDEGHIQLPQYDAVFRRPLKNRKKRSSGRQMMMMISYCPCGTQHDPPAQYTKKITPLIVKLVEQK